MKKSYLVMIGAVLSAVGGYLHGDLSIAEAIGLAINGLGIGALRSAITKIG